MARKIRARLIPQLRAAGHPRNAMARSQKMAKASVIAVFDAADELGIAWEGVEGKTDAEVYSTPFPGRYPAESVLEQPDWGYAHKGLGKTGVTLGMLHAGYADACAREGGVPMSYATFWRGYGRFVERSAVTSHMTRRAGRSVEAGWSGPTMSPADAATGEIVKVDLFVASPSHGRYDYVEPTLDMKRDTWLPCHVHMLELFGASVPRIIPDDCKAAIVRHPKEGEVVLDDAYRETAARYGAAVLPARVRKPRDRPAAEGPVGNIATGIIAAPRNETSASMAQLRAAVAERLDEHDARPSQKREGSRGSALEREERPQTQGLPAVPYEICHWLCDRKVAPNCHVAYARNHYSCSWRHVGEDVDPRVTQTTIEIYAKSGERLATHPPKPPYVKNEYPTHDEDMPDGKVWREWDGDRMRRWAGRTGPFRESCVNRILESVRLEEQGLDAALALIRLSGRYSAQRLGRACEIALDEVRAPRHRHVKAISDANADKASAHAEAEPGTGGYVRGASHYGKGRERPSTTRRGARRATWGARS